MSFRAVLSLSLAASVLAAAVPQQQPGSAMVGRDVPILGPPGLTAWSDKNFQGKKVHYTSPEITWNTCYVFTNDFPVGEPGGISSVASDPHNYCTLFPNEICDPGPEPNDNTRLGMIGSYYDLADPEEGWDNRAASFSCAPLGY